MKIFLTLTVLFLALSGMAAVVHPAAREQTAASALAPKASSSPTRPNYATALLSGS